MVLKFGFAQIRKWPDQKVRFIAALATRCTMYVLYLIDVIPWTSVITVERFVRG